MSISRRASSTLLLPRAENSGPSPPNVPAPKLNAGTLRPDAPRLRYCILAFPVGCRLRGCRNQSAVEVHAPQRDGEAEQRDRGGDQRQCCKPEPGIDRDSPSPCAERIAKIESRDVETGGEVLSGASGFFEHPQLKWRDRGESRNAQQTHQ